jgi:hypothetical protein
MAQNTQNTERARREERAERKARAYEALGYAEDMLWATQRTPIPERCRPEARQWAEEEKARTIAYWEKRVAEARAEWLEANKEDTEETTEVSEETTEATEQTTEDTEVVELDADTRSRAIEGAQRCVDHWANEGEDELLAEAKARLERVLHGTANRVDIEGALDWLDYQPTDPMAQAIEYIAQHWGADETADWLAHNEGDEADAIATTLLKWQGEADAEGTEPVPTELIEWANETLA